MSATTLAQEDTQRSNYQQSSLEQKAQAYYQRLYNNNAEAIYRYCHPFGSRFGHAAGVIVENVKITQWRDGVATTQGSDVVQFTVDYTVLWSSLMHPNGGGHTEARSTYVVTDGDAVPISNIILSSNSKHLTTGQAVKLLDLAKVGKVAAMFL